MDTASIHTRAHHCQTYKDALNGAGTLVFLQCAILLVMAAIIVYLWYRERQFFRRYRKCKRQQERPGTLCHTSCANHVVVEELHDDQLHATIRTASAELEKRQQRRKQAATKSSVPELSDYKHANPPPAYTYQQGPGVEQQVSGHTPAINSVFERLPLLARLANPGFGRTLWYRFK